MADLKIGRLMMGICQTNCYFVYEEGKNLLEKGKEEREEKKKREKDPWEW